MVSIYLNDEEDKLGLSGEAYYFIGGIIEAYEGA